MKRLADFILAHPIGILIILAVLTGLSFYPALQIRTDFNLESFFPKDDPSINDYERLEEEFGRDDNIIMVGFETDSLLTEGVLHDLRSIIDSVETIPNVAEVRSLWSAKQIHSKGANLSFDPYLSSSTLGTLNADSLRKLLVNDPFAKGFLINNQGTATAFYLEIEAGKNNYEARDTTIAQLEQLLESYESTYDFKISGIPYYRNQYVSYLNDEILFYISLSSVLVILLLWLLYRSSLGIVLPMLIVWLTILFTLAIMQLTGGYFEVMTSTIAPILLCVGIADSIHMISKYDDARLQGLNNRVSIREMLMTLGSATFLTSITTAIGFGTLMTSDIVPMKRFGIYTAAGVMIAYVVTILMVPDALSLIKVKKVFHDKSADIFTFFANMLSAISRFNQQYYKQITLVFLVSSVAIGLGATYLKVNGKVFDELGNETQPIQDARFFSTTLSPPFPMEFIIDTGRESGILKPEFVAKVDKFTRYLQSYEEIERVTSFNTLMKEVHKAMAPAEAAEYALPENDELMAQYVLLLEINNAETLEQTTDFSYQTVRIAAQVQDAGSDRINQIRKTINQYLDKHFEQESVTVTGSTILSADLNQKIVSSLLRSILLAFVLVAFIMAFLFKNVRMVFISLIPNILPLIMVAGIMGYTGIDIKSSTAVIFTVAFGIAVDDSIHYLARLRIEMLRGCSLQQALQLATQKTGKAIIVTSLILLAGFGTLLTSVFSSTVYMGLLVCLTVIFAVLADLLLLPSLFYWIRPEFNLAEGDPTHDSRSGYEAPQEKESHRA